MKTETINDYGRLNGYPVYVFDDGTLDSYRDPGKTLMYKVSGPLANKLLLKAESNKSMSLLQKSSSLLAKIVSTVFGATDKKSQNYTSHSEPEYVDYEDVSEDELRLQMLESIPKVRELRKKGVPVKSFVIEHGDFRCVGFGVSDAETFHRKIKNPDGSTDEISHTKLKFD